MSGIEEALKKHGFQNSVHAFDQAVKTIQLRKSGKIRPYVTKWPRFNALLGGGLQPSTIYTIGGRPGIGKSSFANNLLLDICEMTDMSKAVICYWTWEMPAYQQVIRAFSNEWGKTVNELISAHDPLGDDLLTQIAETRERWVWYPIYFMSYSMTPDSIYTTLESIQGADPSIHIINLFDHTRLARKSKGIQSEEEKISRLYYCAQQLSVRFGMTNIFLSQLNRDIESEFRKRLPIPQLSDFFGADSVGQFSNVAIALQQPVRYQISEYLSEDTKDLLAVHILKNRDGAVQWIPFNHQLSINRMQERYPIITNPTYTL